MNDNNELLAWAVENITEWNDDYTHLRSDSNKVNSLFCTNGTSWRIRDNEWACPMGDDYTDNDDFCTSFSTHTPQVITKQEWQDAKLRNAFNTVLEMRHSSSCKPLQGHIHAQLMAEYAEVAKTNPEPWKEFEKGILDDNGELEWVSMTLLDAFESWHKYRRKPSPPKTMTIGGIVVEAWPLESLNGISGDYIYTIESGVEHQVIAIPTKEIYTGPRYLAGKYFSTKEQAQAVADALNRVYNDALVGWKQQ